MSQVAASCGTNEATFRGWLKGNVLPTDDEWQRIVARLPAMKGTLEDLREEREDLAAAKKGREERIRKPICVVPIAPSASSAAIGPSPVAPTRTDGKRTRFGDNMSSDDAVRLNAWMGEDQAKRETRKANPLSESSEKAKHVDAGSLEDRIRAKAASRRSVQARQTPPAPKTLALFNDPRAREMDEAEFDEVASDAVSIALDEWAKATR